MNSSINFKTPNIIKTRILNWSFLLTFLSTVLKYVMLTLIQHLMSTNMHYIGQSLDVYGCSNTIQDIVSVRNFPNYNKN